MLLLAHNPLHVVHAQDEPLRSPVSPERTLDFNYRQVDDLRTLYEGSDFGASIREKVDDLKLHFVDPFISPATHVLLEHSTDFILRNLNSTPLQQHF